MIGLAGTAYYIAPEVFTDSYNEKCDIWSCGIIAHVLLTGQLPFNLSDYETEDDIYRVLESNPIFKIDKLLNHVSENGKDFLKKMLELDPSKRLSAAKALKHRWFESSGKERPKRSVQVLQNIKKFSLNNKMKNAVLQFVSMNQVPLEARQTYNEIFDELD